jgi:LL-diaminopimelate aminotransferase
VTKADREARSQRIRDLPAYLFEDLVRTRIETEKRGVDVVDLSLGDPDLGAPEVVVETLREHAADKRLHSYTPPWAVERFSEAVARWMERRYGVALDPATEIHPIIGTKEGLAHLPPAMMDPGDVALVTDPGYPVYSRSVWFAGGTVEWLPIVEERRYLPDLGALAGKVARLAFVNYPNNPTSAVADPGFFSGLVDWARESGAYVVNDAAYAEITFDGARSPSILEVPGAKEVAVEFHSFSKTFNMAGWRVGFVAGNAGAVGALKTFKSNLDSGVFGPILLASVAALEGGEASYKASLNEYQARRELVVRCLARCGIQYFRSPATLYVWARVPRARAAGRGGSVEAPPGGRQAGSWGSMDFARLLLEKAGVLVAPGAGFGQMGEGHFRISITCPRPRIEEAGRRIEETSQLWRT